MTDTHPDRSSKRYHSRTPSHSRKRGRGPAPEPKKNKPVCCICSDPNKPPSYKCPKCLALYCSVVCCKEHKVVCTGNPPSPPKPSLPFLAPHPQSQPHNYNRDEDREEEAGGGGWQITDEMKNALQNSQWLRQQLQDGGLRDLIRQIVAAGDGLQQQRFPQFQGFVDKLLVIAGVLEREDDIDEPLEECLERDWSHDPPQLSLRPWRRKLPVFQPVDVSSSEEENSDDASSEMGDEGEEKIKNLPPL